MSKAYGFASPGDFYRATDGAKRGDRAAREQPVPMPNPFNGGRFVPAVVPTKVSVKIKEAKVDGDDRNYYPAEVYLRELAEGSRADFWQGLETDYEQRDNECVAVTQNGEPLRKTVVYEGRVVGFWEIQDPEFPEDAEKRLNVSCVMIDLQDSADIVRVDSADADEDGYQDAYLRQPTGDSTATLEDGERIWVKNYGGAGDPVTAGHYHGSYITRHPSGSKDGRAVYGVAPAEGGEAVAVPCTSGFAGWDDGTCVTIAITEGTGKCANVTATSMTGVWDAGEDGWVGGETIEVATGDGTPIVFRSTDGQPRMRIEIGGTPTYGKYMGCTAAGEVFEFGGAALCDDEAGDCNQNVFTATVSCTPCVAACSSEGATLPLSMCFVIKNDTSGTVFLGSVMTFGLVPADWEDCVLGGPATFPTWNAIVGIDADADEVADFFVFWSMGSETLEVSCDLGYRYTGTNTGTNPPGGAAVCSNSGSGLGFNKIETENLPVVIRGLSRTQGISSYNYDVIFTPAGDCTDLDLATIYSNGLAAGGEPLNGHPPIEVVVVGGPHAGTHNFTWDAGDSRYEDGADTLTQVGVEWTLVLGSDSGDTSSGTYFPRFSTDPRPFGMIWDKDDFGATQNVTASL